ncbi:MAG: YCF48-related protein [Planctomycetaceae bacterium]
MLGGVAAALLLIGALSVSSAAEPRTPEPKANAQSTVAGPTPLQDDANLHDVAFVGTEIGWAVGDRGTVWKTRDGGETWEFLKTPVDCSLKSVCFLSDRIGWAAGGGITPYTHLSFGVVLYTHDGGVTWKKITTAPLPHVEYIRFFTMQEGVIAGASDAGHPTGILVTHDGGKTWENVDGTRQTGWRAADFLRPDVGVTAGLRGATAQIDAKVLESRNSRVGLQNLHDLKLNADDSGWLVGDGGLALVTANRGVTWQEPPTPLPLDLRNMTDFHAVACRGKNVWLAGSPGSVIWHTPDGGHSWLKQRTNQSSPIARIRFSNDENGFAVGAFGLIIRTKDGGRTWSHCRGMNRRAAILSMHAYPSRVSFPLIAKQSADLGYRSVAILPARGDIGQDNIGRSELDLQLETSVVAAGGSAGEFGWQFPVGAPDLGHDAAKLLAEWNRVTEGKLQEVLLGRIVAQIRTWKPEIIVLDEPPADDAATRLLNEAVLAAVKQAEDPTWHIPQNELAELEPWKVKRVFLRVLRGSSGETVVDANQYSQRLGSTILDVAAPAAARLIDDLVVLDGREEYRLIADGSANDVVSDAPRDFFAGLSIAPGTDARRILSFDNGTRGDEAEKRAQHRRNFQMAAKSAMNDPRQSAQLIGQLRESTAGLRADQAATQLLQLAENYRRNSQWDLADSTLIELVSRYPSEPASAVAMKLLFQTWAGAEPTWQRLRRTRIEKSTTSVSTAAVSATFERVEHLLQVDPALRETVTLNDGPDPLQLVSDTGSIELSGSRDIQTATVEHWQNQAFQMAALIRAKSPALYATPGIQFPLSALCRQRGKTAQAMGFLGKYQAGEESPGDAWSIAAASEAHLAEAGANQTRRTLKCLAARVPPMLDGVLSDDCWQEAKEIRLTRSDVGNDGSAAPIAFLAYDAEHLYFAASIPRAPGVDYSGPMKAGRTHDSELTGHDRIVLAFDTDRDYATWYTIAIDERGWLNERCWDDGTWNPRMWVEVAADETHWRIEAAIPFDEMMPPSRRPREAWGVGIVRVIPSSGVEGWTHPAASTPRPESFGVVRFE